MGPASRPLRKTAFLRSLLAPRSLYSTYSTPMCELESRCRRISAYPFRQPISRAACEIEVDRMIESGTSFAVERVLSSEKYKARVERAKACGFKLGLIFVTLATPQDCIDRIRLCVAQGGHDVPPEKVVTRWDRSLAKHLPWFALRADRAMIFDNTGARQSRATRVARFETLERYAATAGDRISSARGCGTGPYS